ncbi:MAG TPA: SH3 domain-containing protein [Sphingomicrobium sp.]|nr:SH3 domain-containing protein [Sphingomicrobium sp.]
MSGPSSPPDPATHAYRKDLADIAVAGRVIASHYAEPLRRHIVCSAPFRAQPDDNSEPLGQLNKGDEIRTLDVSSGWAWGYAPDGRVGYVRAEAIAA